MVEGARLEIAYTATYRGFESHPLRQLSFLVISPSLVEVSQRDAVVSAILSAVRESVTVKLPDFDRASDLPGAFALESIGIEPNPYGGTVGDFRYQFEGEEDLLHLMVFRLDRGEISPEEGQAVAAFLFPNLAPTLVWFRPGERSQHFYLGHDVLLELAE